MRCAPSTPDGGVDHRGAGVRLPETKGPAARLEHRISGADVNPYLMLAAVLGGMMHGLETAPDLPLPLDDENAVPSEPLGHDWFDAVDRFAHSDIAAEIFGADYRHVYAAVKQDEIQTLGNILTATEYRYYLSRM